MELSVSILTVRISVNTLLYQLISVQKLIKSVNILITSITFIIDIRILTQLFVDSENC